MEKFKVISIEKANKTGYVVVRVKYNDTSKEYTFVRRAYPYQGGGILTKSVVIEGYRIRFDTSYNVLSIEKEYETAGKKVTKVGSIHSSIKKEIM